MTDKQYKICRLAIIIVLSFSISVSITLENYILPIVFVLTAFTAMYQCKKSYGQGRVLADERDYKIAGDAARYAIYIYSWIGAIGTFVLMALSERVGTLYAISQMLAYSVCFLMLMNAFIFKYLDRKNTK
jgi:uncharacterized membrane protein